VRPFNFLNSFQARWEFNSPDADQLAISKRGRPRKQSSIKPVAPFDKDMRKAAQFAFDRETGNSVEAERLMTYAEALAQYHLRPEAKFLNGDFFDRGRTERRHVVASQIIHIGRKQISGRSAIFSARMKTRKLNMAWPKAWITSTRQSETCATRLAREPRRRQ
jgi:hypothetical protein